MVRQCKRWDEINMKHHWFPASRTIGHICCLAGDLRNSNHPQDASGADFGATRKSIQFYQAHWVFFRNLPWNCDPRDSNCCGTGQLSTPNLALSQSSWIQKTSITSAPGRMPLLMDVKFRWKVGSRNWKQAFFLAGCMMHTQFNNYTV